MVADRRIKYIIYFFAALSSVIFIIARIHRGEKLFEHHLIPYYGDLYKQNFIDHFDTLIVEPGTDLTRYYRTDRNPEINEADLLFYGDSFSFIEYHKTLPEVIGDSLNKKVYFENLNELGFRNNPFQSLVNYNYTKTEESKFIIYEIGEAALFQRFSQPYDVNPGPQYDYKPIIKSISGTEADMRYTRLMQTSVFSHNIYSKIASFKFNQFGYISRHTPYYTLTPEPWLFSFDRVKILQKGPLNELELTKIVDNIEHMKNELYRLYNLKLIFVLVPGKSTIYGELVNLKEYNNLLPRIYPILDRHDIIYVNLLDEFRKSDKILYHTTDTHWNNLGIAIAAKKIMQKLN